MFFTLAGVDIPSAALSIIHRPEMAMILNFRCSALTRIAAFVLVLSCLIHHDIVEASLRDAIILRTERQANGTGNAGSLDINPKDFLPTRKGLQRSGAASPPEAEGGASPPEPPSGEAAGGSAASTAQMEQLLALLIPLLSPAAAGGGGGAEPPMEMG